ncbi:hypothetical protein ACWGDT_23075 [Streptomyces avermitilis]
MLHRFTKASDAAQNLAAGLTDKLSEAHSAAGHLANNGTDNGEQEKETPAQN